MQYSCVGNENKISFLLNVVWYEGWQWFLILGCNYFHHTYPSYPYGNKLCYRPQSHTVFHFHNGTKHSVKVSIVVIIPSI